MKRKHLKNLWTKIKSHSGAFLNTLLGSKLFLQNFLYIGGIMMLFFLVFAITTYKQSYDILLNEFSASSEHQLEITANTVDTHLKDMRYIIATLDKNSLAQAFFAYQDPERLHEGFEDRLQESLQSYINSHSSIDSIYLYSGLTDTIITDSTMIRSSQLQDNSWMEYLTQETNSGSILLLHRAKDDFYPYILTLMKPMEINGYKAAIVLNLNLSKVSYLTNVSSDPYQEIYLVSDEKQVLYRYYQQELLEPLENFPKLSGLQDTKALSSTVITDSSDSYILTQIHSQHYPWYYVTITNLEMYTNQLASNNAFLTLLFLALFLAALLISFLFSVRSTKPIHKLLILLKDPHNAISNDPLAKNEIHYISEQIISYAQQNKELSDELTKRLNLLNETKLLALQSQINPHFLFNTLNMIHTYECEELGYRHKLPELTLSLSRLLRYAFQSTDLVTLDTELNFTKMYLSLMQKRYNNRFQIIYCMEPETLEIRVPKLFIQPIIENSIFHGLAKKPTADGVLTLSSGWKDGKCMITVHDNGVGMDLQTLEALRSIADEEIPQNSSVGLRNVIVRMKLLYGEEFTFTIDSRVGEGSTFMLWFPTVYNREER